MKLNVVIPAAHNPEMTRRCLELATKNATDPCTTVGVFDNGVGYGLWGTGVNVGNYEVFVQIRNIDTDVVLVIHNDLFIWEEGYDKRILAAFGRDAELGLLGFVGSDTFDIAGGRGQDAWSNFMGWEGCAPAEHHGPRVQEFKAAANLDGCAMAFRQEALRDVCPATDDPPPHHFYDRLFCALMMAGGWHVGFLGIQCDHLNGQTANVFDGYHDLAREWCERNECVRTGNPDQDVYLEAEHRFLEEWRDNRRFIPLKVGQDHSIYHTHPTRGL
jgi:hypothetical protein